MNILSFDIEEWYFEKFLYGDRKEMYPVYMGYLDRILDMLDREGDKATFFCVGEMAKHFPDVIRKIDTRGHEIGCHSNTHTWLNKLTEEQMYADTRDSLASIEDAIGRKVISYRAPAFSIGESNKYAFEVLAECGIECDASVYPASRDFGGFSSFGAKEPCIIKIGNKSIKEFPICLTTAFGRGFAYSGGGYFRLLPLWFVKKVLSSADYGMCYFHIEDLMYRKYKMHDREFFENYYKIPGTFKNRFVRMIKGSIGTKGAFNEMEQLVSSFEFVNLEKADQLINWNETKVIDLKGNI